MARVIAQGAATFLAGIVDYAGLFPPAELSMESAVAEYARQLRSSEGFILGRFVVPVSRLEEFEAAAEGIPGAGDEWRLSVLLGPGSRAGAATLASFNARRSGRFLVDTVEWRAEGVLEVEAALLALPASLTVYVELPIAGELDPFLAVLKARGARAKIRTGGTTSESIPAPSSVARFLLLAARAHVPFKATAGLHHPLRSIQPLTYAPESPRAMMHGFLNLFAASVLAFQAESLQTVEEVLREERPEAFSFDEDGMRVGPHRISTSRLADVRRAFACSFGSCSVAEPVADLCALGVL